MLDRHAARTHQIHRLHIHALIIGRRGALPLLATGPGSDQHRAIALGGVLPLPIQTHRQQRPLAADDLLDALSERRPLVAGDLEMAPQVQQRELTHAVIAAHRLHQAIGVVGLPGAATLDAGAPDVHGGYASGRSRGRQYLYASFWHYNSRPEIHAIDLIEYSPATILEIRRKSARIQGAVLKMG